MEVLLLGVVAVGLGIAAMFATRGDTRRQRAHRELQAMPRLSPATPVGATVVAIGVVRPHAAELDAPLSGRPCVAYCATIYPAGDHDGAAHDLAGCVPFQLERDDGTLVAIDAAHARFLFPPLPLPADAADRCREAALALGIAPRALARVAYEEIIVLEGMRVAVAGTLVAHAAGDEPAHIAGDVARPIVIGVPF